MRIRPLAVILVLTLAASLQVAATARPSLRPTTQATAGKETPKRALDQRPIARRLANALVGARTERARRRAVMNALQTLGVSVLKGSGQSVLGDSPPSRLHVYEFELQALARKSFREPATAIADLARALAPAARKLGGRPPSAELMADVLRRSTSRMLRQPRDPRALPALLMRELGLRHASPIDLARPAPVAELRLDGFQQLLFLAELGAELDSLGRDEPRRGEGASAAARPPGPCDGKLDDTDKAARKWGKWFIQDLGKLIGKKWLENVGKGAKAAGAVLDVLHAGLLAWLLDYQQAVGGQNSETHYGPAGHRGAEAEAGKQIVLQVGVQMIADVPPAIRCGELAGYTIPDKGPVKGVPIDWDPLLLGDMSKLKRHGTVVREDPVTGADGLAIFIFEPKDERNPGIGLRRYEVGVLQPTAKLFTVFGNTLAYLAEALTPPFVTLGWTVEWHEPMVLDADITLDHSAAQRATSRYTVRVRDMQLEPGPGGQLSGTQALQVVDFRQDPYEPWKGCRGLTGVASVTVHEPLRVLSLAIDPSTGAPGAMEFEPGLVDFYTENLTCDPRPPHACCIHLIDEHHWLRWSTLWQTVLGDRRSLAGSPRGTIDGWEQVAEDGQPGPDGVIARKTIEHNGPPGVGTLRAVLTLRAAGQ